MWHVKPEYVGKCFLGRTHDVPANATVRSGIPPQPSLRPSTPVELYSLLQNEIFFILSSTAAIILQISLLLCYSASAPHPARWPPCPRHRLRPSLSLPAAAVLPVSLPNSSSRPAGSACGRVQQSLRRVGHGRQRGERALQRRTHGRKQADRRAADPRAQGRRGAPLPAGPSYSSRRPEDRRPTRRLEDHRIRGGRRGDQHGDQRTGDASKAVPHTRFVP
jgi:hypothetical protein